MRIFGILIAGLALFLSGCGDRGVLFAGCSPDDVADQLEKIDGIINVQGEELTPPTLKVSRPDPATVLVTIAGRNGGKDASVRFMLSADGNDTRVSFEAQVPHDDPGLDGQRPALSQDKVDERLESGLKSLALAMRSNKEAPRAIKPLNYAIGLLALASDPPESRRLMALASQANAQADGAGAASDKDSVSDDSGADAADDTQGDDPAPDDDGGDQSDT